MARKPRKKKKADGDAGAEDGPKAQTTEGGEEVTVDGPAELPTHTVPETHLSEAQKAEEPGGDGMGREDVGTAHAASIVGGSIGQAVGLPVPLSAEEAGEAYGEEAGGEGGAGSGEGSGSIEGGEGTPEPARKSYVE